MRLTMLGTGHAMVTECYNTCFVLSDETGLLLVDGGGGNGLLRQLRQSGIEVCDIREVFVTHRHLDHIMGVVWLLRVWTQRMLHGAMEGDATIYAHDEVCAMLQAMGSLLLNEDEAGLIGNRIRLVRLADGRPVQLEGLGRVLVPFDLRSTKAKQFGFRLELEQGRWLTCCGDEPLPPELYTRVQNSAWLLHEAFCQQDELDPALLARMHHSSVADACRTAQELGVANLVLYHSSDKDLTTRRERYLAEGSRYYSGRLHVPYDLESIELE